MSRFRRVTSRYVSSWPNGVPTYVKLYRKLKRAWVTAPDTHYYAVESVRWRTLFERRPMPEIAGQRHHWHFHPFYRRILVSGNIAEPNKEIAAIQLLDSPFASTLGPVSASMFGHQVLIWFRGQVWYGMMEYQQIQ